MSGESEKPLRDVLREVENVYDVGSNPTRLARELRALAPLLRAAGRELSRHLHPDDRVLLDRLNAKADELEAK